MDSDFTVGFRQGQEHGKQIAQERIEDILDKIRAEIEQDACTSVSGSKFIFVSRVNQIIDKYKTESEDKE